MKIYKKLSWLEKDLAGKTVYFNKKYGHKFSSSYALLMGLKSGRRYKSKSYTGPDVYGIRSGKITLEEFENAEFDLDIFREVVSCSFKEWYKYHNIESWVVLIQAIGCVTCSSIGIVMLALFLTTLPCWPQIAPSVYFLAMALILKPKQRR